MTSTSNDPERPILLGPTEKERKYDRQLRLWAAKGQHTLENSDILLVNSGSGVVGLETLKNLVLPGIGKFTIIDDATVCQADLGVNFFLDGSCPGKPRAECCVKFLEELNPDVTGEFYSNLDVVYLESFLEERCFSFIICSLPIPTEIFSILTKHVNKNQIPFISIHSVGFYSYFRSIIPRTIPLVDTHPDIEATTDLRLLSPWDELSEFSAALTRNIEKLSDHEHGHIPYVSLLLHFLKIWNKKYGKYPDTYAEKIEFRRMVAAGERLNGMGGEENFQEAVAVVLKTIKTTTLPSNTREVFEYQPKDNEAKSSFWVITDAIKKFYDKNNSLPLPGSVPDMKAESRVYVQLQKIYLNKSRQDIAEVLQTVREHPYGKDIERAEVENFCKNAAHIKLLRALNETKTDLNAIARTEFKNDESSTIMSQPLSLIPIYLAINATSHSSAASASEITQRIDKEVSNAASNERIQKAAQEVARAKGGELHNISALTGGMVAQEVIKIITKQYIPIDNTCIFDGISSRAQVLRI